MGYVPGVKNWYFSNRGSISVTFDNVLSSLIIRSRFKSKCSRLWKSDSYSGASVESDEGWMGEDGGVEV